MDKMLEKLILKTHAVQEIEKLINTYEYKLSRALLEDVEQLFALKMPDVRIELSFGKYLGPEGVHRCIVGLHGKMFREADGQPAIGTFHMNNNTTGIIEVAGDLKTAKGLWTCPGTYNNKDASSPTGAVSMAGACLRSCDFIYDEEEGKWKMWHYVVTGVMSYRMGETPASGGMDMATADWKDLFDETSRPDGPPTNSWVYAPNRRVEYKDYNRVPEPYETFSETFSY